MLIYRRMKEGAGEVGKRRREGGEVRGRRSVVVSE